MTKKAYITHLQFKANDFLELNNLQELALCLKMPKQEIEKWAKFPSYKNYNLPKKSGGYRQICEPQEELKILQRRIAELLNVIYPNFNEVHGFVKSFENTPKNVLSNAQNHLGKKWVWNLDIQDFFGSISALTLTQCFMNAPFNFAEGKAKFISLLLVYEKQLPAGAPSSPVISNLVCMPFDYAIRSWVKQQNDKHAHAHWVYTRYADDLSFSCNEPILPEQKQEVFKILKQFGFEPNSKKERLFSSKQAQWVTGIKVNVKPNLDRRFIRNIRAMLHHAAENGLAAASSRYFYEDITLPSSKEDIYRFLRILKGKIDHVGYVKGKQNPIYLMFKQEWYVLWKRH